MQILRAHDWKDWLYSLYTRGGESRRTTTNRNLHFFMIKTQATPNIQHFIDSILLTDNHNKIIFSVIKYIVHIKKSTRRWRHCITSHRHSPQSPNNIGVSQHFVKKNSEKEHVYNQHIGRLNTNDAKDSTFHWQTIIIECLEVCNKRTVGLFVWSRDHSESPCSSKYLYWKCVCAVFIVGIAVKTATIGELGARTSSLDKNMVSGKTYSKQFLHFENMFDISKILSLNINKYIIYLGLMLISSGRKWLEMQFRVWRRSEPLDTRPLRVSCLALLVNITLPKTFRSGKKTPTFKLLAKSLFEEFSFKWTFVNFIKGWSFLKSDLRSHMFRQNERHTYLLENTIRPVIIIIMIIHKIQATLLNPL